MIRYVLKRILWMIPIVLGVAILVFTLMTFCPGNPAEIILGSTATEEALAAKTEELGLNDPFLVRLGNYLIDVFIKRDLGASWATNVSIMTSIGERLPRTLTLTLSPCFLLSVWAFRSALLRRPTRTAGRTRYPWSLP